MLFLFFTPKFVKNAIFGQKCGVLPHFNRFKLFSGEFFLQKPHRTAFRNLSRAQSSNRRTNPIRNAPQHNNICAHIIIYAHIHTCARARAYTYFTLFICVYLRHPPPVTPRIIIACAKTRVKSLRTAQKNERFRIQSKTLVCQTDSKNRFGRIFFTIS